MSNDGAIDDVSLRWNGGEEYVTNGAKTQSTMNLPASTRRAWVL